MATIVIVIAQPPDDTCIARVCGLLCRRACRMLVATTRVCGFLLPAILTQETLQRLFGHLGRRGAVVSPTRCTRVFDVIHGFLLKKLDNPDFTVSTRRTSWVATITTRSTQNTSTLFCTESGGLVPSALGNPPATVIVPLALRSDVVRCVLV